MFDKLSNLPYAILIRNRETITEMEDRVVTIKDIASDLGVSLSTVHKAIYNKKGVGEETRKRILDYANAHDFQINRMASSLKRRPVRLAYVGVETDPSQNFYYRQLNASVRESYENYRAFNVELHCFICQDDCGEQLALLEKLFEERHDSLDGLLLVCTHEYSLNPILRRYHEAGIYVVTLHSDARNSTRECFVGTDNLMVGAMAQELALDLGIPENGQILLLGGSQEVSNHRMMRKAFREAMLRDRPDVDIIELFQGETVESTQKTLIKYLKAFSEISFIYSVTARSTYAMCCAIRELGLSGKMKAVGTDVFEELHPFFEDRSLTATIFQNFRQLADKALECLYILVTKERPVEEYLYQRSDIVIRSNARGYYSKVEGE